MSKKIKPYSAFEERMTQSEGHEIERSQAPTAGNCRRYMPDARESALLLLRIIQAKEQEAGRSLSRFRVSEITLENVTGRRRVKSEFLEEMNQWLFRAGRALFFSGGSFGLVLTSAVDSWSRLSSRRIRSELDEVEMGTYDFSKLEPLLSNTRDDHQSSPE
jgi:hypothetical protein